MRTLHLILPCRTPSRRCLLKTIRNFTRIAGTLCHEDPALTLAPGMGAPLDAEPRGPAPDAECLHNYLSRHQNGLAGVEDLDAALLHLFVEGRHGFLDDFVQFSQKRRQVF